MNIARLMQAARKYVIALVLILLLVPPNWLAHRLRLKRTGMIPTISPSACRRRTRASKVRPYLLFGLSRFHMGAMAYN
jgi:hypothetical protein